MNKEGERFITGYNEHSIMVNLLLLLNIISPIFENMFFRPKGGACQFFGAQDHTFRYSLTIMLGDILVHIKQFTRSKYSIRNILTFNKLR